MEALRTKDTIQLQTWLGEFCKPGQPGQSHDRIQPLFDLARQYGWDKALLDKLDIFVRYHQGNLRSAFELATPYLGHPGFDPDIFVIACLTLYHSSQYDDAYLLLKSSAAFRANLENRTDYLITAGLIYLSSNHRKEALDCFVRGLQIAPEDLTLLYNCYAFFFEMGELAAFTQIKEKVQSKQYQFSEAALAVAYVELAQNNYKDGLRILEQRYDMSGFRKYLNHALLNHPKWQYDPLEHRRLLITAEQGLGDTIMMARYFHEIPKLTNNVQIECQFEALSLLTYNFPELSMVPTQYGELKVKDFDVWIASLSLPYVFQSTCESIPGKPCYLRPPPDYQAYWSDRVRDIARPGYRKVGIAWSGQPAHAADRRRSLSSTMVFPLIEALDEIDFFALQIKVPQERPSNLHDVSEEMTTLADTAALIDEMDLVITVDTSVVHLAGAIGKQTWLLLPYRYEWRWGTEGEQNCWYDSVRVLRQPSPGAWAPILSKAFGRELSKHFRSNYQEHA